VHAIQEQKLSIHVQALLMSVKLLTGQFVRLKERALPRGRVLRQWERACRDMLSLQKVLL
jgi:hypothetical protein